MRIPAAHYPALVVTSRALSKICAEPKDWNKTVAIPLIARKELQLFQGRLRHMPPRRLPWRTHEWQIWADASDYGLAGMILCPQTRTCLFKWSSPWTENPAIARFGPPVPIRRRELLAMFLFLHIAADMARQNDVQPAIVA